MENCGTPIGLDGDSQKTGHRGKDCYSCFSFEGLAGAECTVRNGGMRRSDGAGGCDGFGGVDGGFDGVGGGFDGFGGCDGIDEGGLDGSDGLDRVGHTLKWKTWVKLGCRSMLGWEATIGDIVS